MSGNIWEWCQDAYTPNINDIPSDGSAFPGPADERVLRGGCFHNWAIHCTVSKRYEIASDYHDGCIGFRLAASAA
jgi:formylglycine-generating enzyme required for sulfatase activity